MEILNDSAIQSKTDVIAHDSYDMGLKDDLLKGILCHGFGDPSDVQNKAIKAIVSGNDLVIRSSAGSGKSIALIIGMLQIINLDIKTLQAIILVPTREIARALYGKITEIGEYLNVKAHCVHGGVDFREEINVLRNSIHVLVSTPGRMHDALRKALIRADELKIFILDEADELLSRGFKEQIVEIFRYIPETAQICFSSPTMPSDVNEMVETYMKNPVRIEIKYNELTLKGIKQYYIKVENSMKFNFLDDLFNTIAIWQVVIYCNTRDAVEVLIKEFNDKSSYMASFIYDNMNQNEKEAALRNFRTGSTRVLILNDLDRHLAETCTSIVINYDFPLNFENYLKRIGRSGRYGHRGFSISFINESELKFLKDTESHFSTVIEELPNDFSNLL